MHILFPFFFLSSSWQCNEYLLINCNELFPVAPLRWNESYKKDLFSSRIDTTKALSRVIAASSCPPHSWVLVSGVGKSALTFYSRCKKQMWGRLEFYCLFYFIHSLLQTQPDGGVHGGQQVDAVWPPLPACPRVGGCSASSWERG